MFSRKKLRLAFLPFCGLFPFLAGGLTAPAYAQSAPAALTQPAPTVSADLAAAEAKAKAVIAALADCSEKNCPQLDCAAKARLVQELIDLETYLDAHLRALNGASGAAASHHASLLGQSGVTQANWANAQGAVILHRMLHDIGSALLDLASIVDFLENIDEMKPDDVVKNSSAVYEVLKDGESLLNTLLGNLTSIQEEIKVAGAIAPAQVDRLVQLGIVPPGSTTEKAREGLNDMISQLTDAINATNELIKAAKEAKTAAATLKKFAAGGGFRGIGQMIGRPVKAWSSQVLDQRKQNLAQQIEAMAAEAGPAGASYMAWLRIEMTRIDNLRALELVRQARMLAAECLEKWCGTASFTRPEVPNFDVSYNDQARYEWGRALADLAGKIGAAVRAVETPAPVKEGDCPDTTAAAPGPSSTNQIPGLDRVPVSARATTDCPACQPVVDRINRLLARKAWLVEESNRIRADVERATPLMHERQRLMKEAEAINQALTGGAGSVQLRSGTPGERRVNRAVAQAEVQALVARAAALRKEAERLRARQSELPAMSDEILEINGKLDRSRQELAICESRCETTPQTPVLQTPPYELGRAERTILDLHNIERAALGLRPFTWNVGLAQGAKEYANHLARTGRRVHASREGRGIVRENLSQGLLGWTAEQLMDSWLKEKQLFRAGTFPDVCNGDWSACGHYSQMIWPDTTDIGCGIAMGSGFSWLVCRYSPGGNKDGKPVGYPVPSAR